MRVGTFKGPIEEMATQAAALQLDVSPLGYGSTSDRFEQVRAKFYPYVEAVLGGEWLYSMVTVIQTNGSIPPHKDAPLRGRFQRYHLVLQTNENAWNYHDGDWDRLEVGGIYLLDQTKVHGAINWGAKPRIHLVVDCAERRFD